MLSIVQLIMLKRDRSVNMHTILYILKLYYAVPVHKNINLCLFIV